MATITFETLTFSDSGNNVRVNLLGLCSTLIPKEQFEQIAPFSITRNSITFDGIYEEQANKSFLNLFSQYTKHLKNNITKNKTTYIHRNSGIPLIGNVAFGIVYRNSNVIEIKPNNGCNLDCVYCSISEGISSKKNDFIVEKDYLVEELHKLIQFVDQPVEVHIGVQGEPFLYGDMMNLIEDIQQMENVHTISIDTNGSLLNKQKIDRLAACDKLQFNLSLDSINPETAKKVAGVNSYNVNHVKDVIAYAAERLNVIVAPVLTKGFNEEEMEPIIKFIKSLPKQPMLGIQNFLRYKTGRNVAKEIPWKEFYELLEKLEQKHDIKLKLSKEDFNIKKTKKLEKPFKTDDIVRATVMSDGRFLNSKLAVAKDRTISIPLCTASIGKKVNVKITKDKHNTYTGQLVSNTTRAI